MICDCDCDCEIGFRSDASSICYTVVSIQYGEYCAVTATCLMPNSSTGVVCHSHAHSQYRVLVMIQ